MPGDILHKQEDYPIKKVAGQHSCVQFGAQSVASVWYMTVISPSSAVKCPHFHRAPLAVATTLRRAPMILNSLKVAVVVPVDCFQGEGKIGHDLFLDG